MATQKIGTNLYGTLGHPVVTAPARALSLAMQQFVEFLQKTARQASAGQLGTSLTLYGGKPSKRVFLKYGIPASNTQADSPGADLCFIIDGTNNDLYIVSQWVSENSFTVTKILGV
jgi:hypothetical protein